MGDFFGRLLWGLYSPPPLKYTILGRSRAPVPCSRRISEKSGQSPPGGWSSGGLPTFSDFGDRVGVGARDLPEKLVKTGGTSFLSTFWPFWAKVVEFLEPP